MSVEKKVGRPATTVQFSFGNIEYKAKRESFNDLLITLATEGKLTEEKIKAAPDCEPISPMDVIALDKWTAKDAITWIKNHL